ncbi:MAG: amidase [Actinomycetota bacterium]|nr:amidase [Actinomycetota bacterium]
MMSSIADDTRWLDATAQSELVASGKVSPLEMVNAAIERVERYDGALNALTYRWFEAARELASSSTLPDGPFRGVPYLLKDLYAAEAGKPLSNGSKAYKAADYVSSEDTTLISRYKAAGLISIGRSNSPEFGSIPVTEPEAWGPTRNPWDLSRTPGGSSGGSASAVAAGIVPIAHASDGGGSIRIPAACCGLVGLKVSQGRISMGPYRDESNLGVEHCVSRTVRDSARLLDATHGPGIGDVIIAPTPRRPFIEEVGADPGQLRIGFLDFNPRGGDVHADCVDGVHKTAKLLESLGHHVEPGFPDIFSDNEIGRAFSMLWSTNMGTAIRRFSQALGREMTPNDIEAMNWAQAEFAQGVNGVDFSLAQASSIQFRRAIQSWWTQGWDLLLTPTLSSPPLPVGSMPNNPERPMTPLMTAGSWVAFTSQFNISGQPAISLPLHRTAEGLPVGMQLAAAYGREDVLIRVASQLEQAAPWAHLTPNF